MAHDRLLLLVMLLLGLLLLLPLLVTLTCSLLYLGHAVGQSSTLKPLARWKHIVNWMASQQRLVLSILVQPCFMAEMAAANHSGSRGMSAWRHANLNFIQSKQHGKCTSIVRLSSVK
jgi:hypothetical protein